MGRMKITWAKLECLIAYNTAKLHFKTVTSTIIITNKCQVRTPYIKVYYKQILYIVKGLKNCTIILLFHCFYAS